jgi:molybdopterin converting factor small subunit
LSNDQTVSGVLERVKQKYPILAEEKNLLIALNEKYANLNDPVRDTDVVAIFPAVSGG